MFSVEKSLFLKIICNEGVHVIQLWPVRSKLELAEISKKVFFLPCHFLLFFFWHETCKESDDPLILNEEYLFPEFLSHEKIHICVAYMFICVLIYL